MSGLARPSEAVTIAVHACGLLAGAGGAALTTHEMARAIGASEAHLSKVLQRLARAGIVTGRRGPGGGFVLADDPASVSLLQVYEAIEGSLPRSGCMLGLPICSGAACPLSALLSRVTADVADGLASVTLAGLGTSLAPGRTRRPARRRDRSGRSDTRRGSGHTRTGR
ncbi:MAG: Rrf2 family transcriptional regulator [Candidatus Eisenbacteria bacterium]|nr:Rrf2 family transcriptional regulator [Candidatus Eisenbacteria bacterium]